MRRHHRLGGRCQIDGGVERQGDDAVGHGDRACLGLGVCASIGGQ
jgi:hypothetical protein